jgi:glycosyltransferase involved in cell wall biosynthesis
MTELSDLKNKKNICILPRLTGLGGPVSFQNRLITGLRSRGFQVHHNPLDEASSSILVIGGTRQLADVVRARRNGVRVVQRLNGMNWIHRKQPTGLKHYLRSEINNGLLAFIRRFVADHVVYQSKFACNWWQTARGSVASASTVIYNGVDLNAFTPQGSGERPKDHFRLLLVEGHLRGGYEQGLISAVNLVCFLNTQVGKPFELVVAGDVPDSMRQRFQDQAGDWIKWAGVVPQANIPEIDRSAHMLFSADLNAACPNSVIEALACGLPVIAFSTGSLPELVGDEGGRVVPYGSNYWNLEKPDILGLAGAAREILSGGEVFRVSARSRAETFFGIDHMVDQYVHTLLG